MISHTEPRKKHARLCALCHKRPPLCVVMPRRKWFSGAKQKGKPVILKQHDVSRICWKKLTPHFVLPKA